MKKLFSVLLLLSFFSLVLQAKDLDIDKVLVQAKKQDKGVMFFYHIPFCPYCKRMLDKNFKNEKILSTIKKYFILSDIYTKDTGLVKYKDFSGTRKEFAKHMGVKAYPATVFVNKDGKIIHTAIGYRNIGEFLIDIKYAGTGSFKTKTIEEFAEDLEFEEDE